MIVPSRIAGLMRGQRLVSSYIIDFRELSIASPQHWVFDAYPDRIRRSIRKGNAAPITEPYLQGREFWERIRENGIASGYGTWFYILTNDVAIIRVLKSAPDYRHDASIMDESFYYVNLRDLKQLNIKFVVTLFFDMNHQWEGSLQSDACKLQVTARNFIRCVPIPNPMEPPW